MSRYYFHVEGDGGPPDLEGCEFDSAKEARHEAIRAAGSMLRDHCAHGFAAPWSMRVVDRHGIVVCEVSFVAR